MKEIQSKSELTALINSNTPVLLDFYADWCGPCQSLLPVVESLADKHKDDFSIVKINIDTHQDLAQEYAIRSIPSLLFIKDQKVQEKLVGLHTEEQLDTKIHSYVN